jgi:hypothetical protein
MAKIGEPGLRIGQGVPVLLRLLCEESGRARGPLQLQVLLQVELGEILQDASGHFRFADLAVPDVDHVRAIGRLYLQCLAKPNRFLLLLHGPVALRLGREKYIRHRPILVQAAGNNDFLEHVLALKQGDFRTNLIRGYDSIIRHGGHRACCDSGVGAVLFDHHLHFRHVVP